MKNAITIILILQSVSLFSQEMELDSAWIESDSKSLFKEAEELTNIVYYHLELDYLISIVDTSTIKGKARREIYLEQKEELLRKALSNYEELILEYPTSTLYYRALNNQGILQFELKFYYAAKKSFLEVLNSDVQDEEEVSVGHGLMAENFANYRRRASEMLYKIEFIQGNYLEAKKYLEESEKYPYYHWCGNAHEDKNFWLDYQRSKIAFKLENIEEARKIMIPHLFTRKIRTDTELREYLLELLYHDLTKETLIQEFEKAIDLYYTKKKKVDSNYFDYYIPFLGEALKVDIYRPKNKDEALNMIRRKVESQLIYILIKGE